MQNQSALPALLFDLDGTLIDSIQLLLDCVGYAFQGRSRAPTRAQWVAGIGTPLRSQLAQWCDSEQEIDDLIERYRAYQDLHLEELTTLYPGVMDVLTWLRERGHPMAIVTSKGTGMTERSLRHVRIDGLFDTVITCEQTSRHKPEPDPVLLALDRLGKPASQALFVGDSPHDMLAGRAARVHTAAAMWGPFSRETLSPARPDFWASAFPDLRPIITGLRPARD